MQKIRTKAGNQAGTHRKEMRAWRDTSEKLSAALELLENYPVPYPPECLPAVIF